MRVLFITPYPEDEAPSQRFRFEQYYSRLEKKGVTVETAPFLSQKTWRVLYRKGHWLQKCRGILWGFFKRGWLLFTLKKYDMLFIHREMTPIGPPVFEWCAKHLFKRKIIYDFDDAIWLPNTSQANRLVRWLKWHGKVKHICRWSTVVSCGNNYLGQYAKKYSENVRYNPTVVDTEHHHNRLKDQSTKDVVIGWTGTHSTTPYLKLLTPVVRHINQEHEVKWCVIANKEPDLKWDRLSYVEWNKATEIDDLLTLNIGLMPMHESPWTKGKCGFKLLQYMALGIVPVASPTGVNKKIITHGQDGYLCDGQEMWIKCLTELIESEKLRQKMGRQARKKIKRQYSAEACWSSFLRSLE